MAQARLEKPHCGEKWRALHEQDDIGTLHDVVDAGMDGISHRSSSWAAEPRPSARPFTDIQLGTAVVSCKA